MIQECAASPAPLIARTKGPPAQTLIVALDEALQLQREATFRKMALYLGPLLLGQLAAYTTYRVVCEGRTFALGVGPQNAIWSGFWILALLVMAWRLRDVVARVALILWGIQHALIIYGALSDVSVSRTLTGALTIGVGVLLTVSGARCGKPRWRLSCPACSSRCLSSLGQCDSTAMGWWVEIPYFDRDHFAETDVRTSV